MAGAGALRWIVSPLRGSLAFVMCTQGLRPGAKICRPLRGLVRLPQSNLALRSRLSQIIVETLRE